MAIAIPVFTNQLKRSRDAVTMSNVRAVYAEAASQILVDGDQAPNADGVQSGVFTVEVDGEQENNYFVSTELPFNLGENVAKALDKKKGATDNVIQLVFTWPVTNGVVGDVPTANLRN